MDQGNADKNLGDAVVDRETGQGFTPGPWDVHDGLRHSCKCLSVSGGGHPIASVEKGEWGDSYPSIRQQKDTGSIEGKFEAYIERIPYGEIPEDEALANARLIAAAPALLDALKNIAERGGRRECERYSTGIGSCFEKGRRANALFAAEKCCAPCIANTALALVDKPAQTDSE